MLPSFSVQLFTSPIVAQILHTRDSVISVVLETLSEQLECLCGPDGVYDCSLPCAVLESEGKVAHFVHDITYILRCKVGSVQSCLGPWLALLGHMQGMVAERRMVGAHVEYDNPGWERALILLANMGAVLTLMPTALIQTV